MVCTAGSNPQTPEKKELVPSTAQVLFPHCVHEHNAASASLAAGGKENGHFLLHGIQVFRWERRLDFFQ